MGNFHCAEAHHVWLCFISNQFQNPLRFESNTHKYLRIFDPRLFVLSPYGLVQSNVKLIDKALD